MIAKAKIAGIVLATVAVITGGTTGAVKALSSYTEYDDFNSAKRGMYGSEYELSGNFDVAYTYSNISIDDVRLCAADFFPAYCISFLCRLADFCLKRPKS